MRVSLIVSIAALVAGAASIAQAQSTPVQTQVQSAPYAPKSQAVPTTVRATTRLSEQAQIDNLTAEVNALRAQVATMQSRLDALPPGFLGMNNCGAGGWGSGVSQLNPDALFYSCVPTRR